MSTHTFIRLSRAWYGETNIKGRTDDLLDDVLVQTPDGEFSFRKEDMGQCGHTVVAVVHRDAFPAFADAKVSAVFAALSSTKNATLTYIESVLLAHGFEDATPVVSPYGDAKREPTEMRGST